MGWLSRLFGREREASEAPRPLVEEREQLEHAGESETDESEERAAHARDESLGIENRIPPGAG